MTNQLKLKKPLEECDFKVSHNDIAICVAFYDSRVEFDRYYKHKYEGTCVYRYETPEKGEELIKEMYRQVVEEDKPGFRVAEGKLVRFCIDDEWISAAKRSIVFYSPIPQEEFFRQLRERLKEIVEVVEEKDIRTFIEDMQDNKCCPIPEYPVSEYDYFPVVHNLNGYKITIERE